jgi:hypothetical protein
MKARLSRFRLWNGSQQAPPKRSAQGVLGLRATAITTSDCGSVPCGGPSECSNDASCSSGNG